MNVTAHQEKKKNEKTKTGKIKAGEERRRRPISKRLCFALLRLFRGQHGEKIVSVRGVPWVTGTLEKANSYFGQTQTGLWTAPPREAAVDWCSERNIVNVNVL